jgi:hypothetical protein
MFDEPVKPYLILPPVLNPTEDLPLLLLKRVKHRSLLRHAAVRRLVPIRRSVQKIVEDFFESHIHTSGVMELIRMTNIMLPNGTIR